MIDTSTKLTPNLKRLFIEFMVTHHIKRVGSNIGDLAVDILNGGLVKDAPATFADINAALDACRSAADPNPYKDATDEEIATALMERLNARREKLRAR